MVLFSSGAFRNVAVAVNFLKFGHRFAVGKSAVGLEKYRELKLRQVKTPFENKHFAMLTILCCWTGRSAGELNTENERFTVSIVCSRCR